MLLGVLAAIIPVFLVIGAGWLAVRTRYVDAAAVGHLAGFVLRVPLPALIFGVLTGAPLGQTLNRGYLLAYGGASLAVLLGAFALGRWVFRLGMTPAMVQALGMSSANSGFMGFPIAAMMVGPAAAPLLAQNMVVENLLIVPLGMVLAEMGQRRHGSARGIIVAMIRSLARNPLLWAIALGIGVAMTGVQLPAPVARPVTLMGAVAGPVALFVVGGTLAGLPRGGTRVEVARIAAGKLVLHPLAVFTALSFMPGVEPVMVAGGTIFAAMPMMSIFPIIGGRFGMAGLTAAALLVTTVCSAGTITLIVLALKHYGLVSLW